MIAGAGKVIQLRLIVGGSARMPDFASELIAGYKDGWSHVDTIVPAGVAWPEGWLIGAEMRTALQTISQQLVAVQLLVAKDEGLSGETSHR